MDLLNIVLMVVSAVVAWVWPFELFLFAYGVLGPLHYLTEISWLHDRKWFGSSRRDWIVPVFAAVSGCAAYVISIREGGIAPLTVAVFGTTLKVSWFQLMTLMALGAGFGAAFARSAGRKIAYGAALAAIGIALVQSDAGRVLVSVFLLTLIHVLIFTSFFILHGALKARSAVGYVSWALHLALPAAMLAISWSPPDLVVSSESVQRSAPVHDLLFAISRLFGLEDSRSHAITAMQVVAYAYTYHYLNWFSKVQVIRWHDVPRGRLVWIASLWLLAIGLYAADWNLAFVVLLGLSVAHVYLEFPLNWRTMSGIAVELNSRRLSLAVRSS